jgi:hypothetical protein
MTPINRILSIILILNTLMFHVSTNAELLIMKQTDAGFASLDDSDNPNKAKIEEILLKYQWPMSATFALDPIDVKRKILNETGDLFIPDKPNAEELWIEKKIQHETGNNTYRAVFFPTSLYELFTITEYFKTKRRLYSVLYEAAEYLDITDYFFAKDTNPLQRALHTFPFYADTTNHLNFDLSDTIGSNRKPQEIRNQMSNFYKTINKLFLGQKDSAHQYINQQLTTWLMKKYPSLKDNQSSNDCSIMIKNMKNELITDLVATIVAIPLEDTRTVRFTMNSQGFAIINRVSLESENKIIKQYIMLEYEAREHNKALLIRGTTFLPFEAIDINENLFSGSTVRHQETEWFPTEIPSRKTGVTYSFEQAYKKRITQPYSISFANSLFAGIFNDFDACAYNYLLAKQKILGYALLINKNDYIKSNNNDLFFIPPFASLAALFTYGEYFHPRSKAALIGEPTSTEPLSIHGMIPWKTPKKDPAHIIIVIRDPLDHAALFSKFVANNGRIIQLGADTPLTEEQNTLIKQVRKANENAASYYKGIKAATRLIQKEVPKARERIQQRTAKASETQAEAPKESEEKESKQQ